MSQGNEDSKTVAVATNKENWLTPEDKAVIMTQFFPIGATNEDIVYCMNVAQSLGLNPILKQIWFIKRGGYQKDPQGGKDIWVDKIIPECGRDSFIVLAHRSGKFEGIESSTSITQIPLLENGKWETKDELVATAKVWVKGNEKPFTVEVNYSEYVQYKKDKTTVTAMWQSKPHTMLKKVAESQALRKAFNISGLYDESEVRVTYPNNTETEVEAPPKQNHIGLKKKQ